jgi:hypothetical protein
VTWLGWSGRLSVRVIQEIPEYEILLKDLHACNTNLIFTETVTEFEDGLGAFFKETLSMLEELRRERGLDTLSKGDIAAQAQNLDYHLNLSRMQSLSLQKRIQLQINVVSSEPYSAATAALILFTL